MISVHLSWSCMQCVLYKWQLRKLSQDGCCLAHAKTKEVMRLKGLQLISSRSPILDGLQGSKTTSKKDACTKMPLLESRLPCVTAIVPRQEFPPPHVAPIISSFCLAGTSVPTSARESTLLTRYWLSAIHL